MADVQSLRKGDIYEEEGQLWRVLEYQHIKVARGGATIRLKLRNVRSGANVEKTYNNGERVQEVTLEKDAVQYQYTDGQLYYFMNVETFEQVALNADALEGIIEFLTDNQVVVLETYEEEPINVSLPTTVDLKVVWTDAAVVGDTAGAATKQVEVETGLRLQVPMFVSEGDVIRIDTRDSRYVTRVKQ
ncbi:MAG: elongation factor P [Caldilineaceae bacterium]|nr:elongation factor P [Caldilineaceae bacterium]